MEERKAKKTLRAIQDTLRQFDHIQALRQVENELLVKIYGNEAHRHKYRSMHESGGAPSGSLDRNRHTASYGGESNQRRAGQTLSPKGSTSRPKLHQTSEESQSIQLNNIMLPASFRETQARVTGDEAPNRGQGQPAGRKNHVDVPMMLDFSGKSSADHHEKSTLRAASYSTLAEIAEQQPYESSLFDKTRPVTR